MTKHSIGKASRGPNQADGGSSQPTEEEIAAQSLCTQCGLCCNGSLFSFVPLTEIDDVESLKATDIVILEDGQTGLRQSCPYYRNRLCSIYHAGRPKSCCDFECALLKRYAHHEIELEQALEEVRGTKEQLERVTAQLRAQAGANARNLSALFTAWLASTGGCFSTRTESELSLLRDYSKLLSHLRTTFGWVQGKAEPRPDHLP
jgi:hypothetical protein